MRRKVSAKRPVLGARKTPAAVRRPARAASTANQLVAKVRAALLAGEFKAGDFLGTEATLGEHYGVGRSPIRDALRSLEALGIIEIRAGLGGGVYVAQGNPALFADILAIQLGLIGITLSELLYASWAVEGMAVELAVEHRTELDLEVMFGILDDLSSLRDQPVQFVRGSMDFHAALVEASHSRALIAQALMLRHILFRHYTAIATPQVTRAVYDSLRSLAEHVGARAGVKARAQLDAHYQQARRSLLMAQQGLTQRLAPELPSGHY